MTMAYGVFLTTESASIWPFFLFNKTLFLYTYLTLDLMAKFLHERAQPYFKDGSVD